MTKLPAPTGSCAWNLFGLLNCTTGLAVKASGQTVHALAAALVAAVLSFAGQTILFSVLRTRLPRIYQSLVVSRPEWCVDLSIEDVFARTDHDLYLRRGRDAYFFLRYLELLLKIFTPAATLCVPVLIPMNLYGGGGDSGLNSLAVSNIRADNVERLWAHVTLTLLFVAWTCALIYWEMQNYVVVHHTWTTPSSSNAARTVLIRDIPSDYITPYALNELLQDLPGGVTKVWINRDVRLLKTAIAKRDQVLQQLEKAATALIRSSRGQAQETTSSPANRFGHTPSAKFQESIGCRSPPHLHPSDVPSLSDTSGGPAQVERSEGKSLGRHCSHAFPLARWLRYGRFGHRGGSPIDESEICYLRDQVFALNAEIDTYRAEYEALPPMNSAFVQFHSELAASMCCQGTIHHHIHSLSPRVQGIELDTVLWENLDLRWWQRGMRTALVVFLLSVLILAYSVPIAATSFLNKISLVADFAPWLHWIDEAPGLVLAAVQGVLPPIALNILLTIVPMIIRKLVDIEGLADTTTRERRVQCWFFIFLFVQVFVVVSLSGTLIETIRGIATTGLGTVQQVLLSIPKASTFFFSYVAIEGLSTCASALVQMDSLFSRFVYGPVCDRTPRDKWNRSRSMRQFEPGTLLPPLGMFVVISSVFAIMAPLILPLALAVFATSLLVYRYNVLYVFEIRDTAGHFLPVCVHQLFVGLYIMQLCLAGHLFALIDGAHLVSLVQAIVMLASTSMTAFFQYLLYLRTRRLLGCMPLTLRRRPLDLAHEDDGRLRSDEQILGAAEQPFQSEALRVQQPIVWLPRDVVGTSDWIKRRMKENNGIRVSDRNASLDHGGRVRVLSGACDPCLLEDADDRLL